MRTLGAACARTKRGSASAATPATAPLTNRRRRDSAYGAARQSDFMRDLLCSAERDASARERIEEGAPAAVRRDVERAGAGRDGARLADEAAFAAAVLQLDGAERERRADQREEAADVRG